jgi:hypothetical protein
MLYLCIPQLSAEQEPDQSQRNAKPRVFKGLDDGRGQSTEIVCRKMDGGFVPRQGPNAHFSAWHACSGYQPTSRRKEDQPV